MSARRPRARENNVWHAEDLLEIHPFDAENRGIREGDRVSLTSRAGNTTLHARISERMQPGVVYTTFHHGFTGANVVTTEFEDWATGCPEYKVTAVEVTLARKMSEWQEQYLETRKQTTQILSMKSDQHDASGEPDRPVLCRLSARRSGRRRSRSLQEVLGTSHARSDYRRMSRTAAKACTNWLSKQ